MTGIYDLIIIGGGPAGLTASIYARRFGLKVLIIEKLTLGGTINLTHQVDNYPGFPQGISGKDLSNLLTDHCQVYNPEIVYDEVKNLHHENGVFKITGEFDSYQAASLILATGSKPKTMNIPGENSFFGRGVSFCAMCDGLMFKDKEVAVIGGGDSAASEAIYLASLCSKVYLIHRRDKLRAVKTLQEKIEKIENISIIWNSVPLEIIGEKSVSGLQIKNIKTGETAMVSVKGIFVYIGELPQSEIVETYVDTNKEGFILTDEYMRTKTPGLFAIGDLRKKPFKQIVTAISDGAIAAFSAYHYLREGQ